MSITNLTKCSLKPFVLVSTPSPQQAKKDSSEVSLNELYHCESKSDYKKINCKQVTRVLSLVFSQPDKLANFESSLAKKDKIIVIGFIRKIFDQSRPHGFVNCPHNVSNFVGACFSKLFILNTNKNRSQDPIIFKHAIELIKYQDKKLRGPFYFYSILNIERIREKYLDDLIESAAYVRGRTKAMVGDEEELDRSIEYLMLLMAAGDVYNEDHVNSGQQIKIQKIARKVVEISKNLPTYDETVRMMFDENCDITMYGVHVRGDCTRTYYRANIEFSNRFLTKTLQNYVV